MYQASINGSVVPYQSIIKHTISEIDSEVGKKKWDEFDEAICKIHGD